MSNSDFIPPVKLVIFFLAEECFSAG